MIARNGQHLTDHCEILREGREFYDDLYKSQDPEQTPLDTLEREFENLDLPKLSQEGRLALDAPICMEELRAAAGVLNHNKCLGTDGLSPEFYLKFWDSPAPFCSVASRAPSHRADSLRNKKRGGGGYHSSSQEGCRQATSGELETDNPRQYRL